MGVTAADLAAALSLSGRAVDALLGVLAGLKLLSETGGRFTLTTHGSTYLLRSSEFYWGHMILGDRSEMHARLKKV